jgi:hypothetical protein
MKGESMTLMTWHRRGRILAASVTIGIVGIAAAATFAAAGPGTIAFRATADPEFFGTTEQCLFGANEVIEAPNGAPMGSFEFCFATFSGDDSGRVVATGTATFRLAGGTVLATLDLAEIPTTPNGIVQFDSGVVTGGTGAYAGASGSWHGTGPITFDADGNHPNLHFVISLR